MNGQENSVFNYRGTVFTFSKDEPHNPSFLVVLSENSDGLYEPIECTTPSGRIIYLSCRPRPIRGSYGNTVYSPAFNLLSLIIGTDEPVLRESFSRLVLVNRLISQKGNGITRTLRETIDKVFSMSEIDSSALYTTLDLRPIKRERWAGVPGKYFHRPKVPARIDYIDQNVKNFVKNERIYAGLSFLRDSIPSLKYGFAVYEPREKVTGPPEIIFHTSHVYWYYEGDDEDGIDSGHILNKIVESVLLLLSYTGCNEPVLDIYQALQNGVHIRLSVDCLVRLIEALLTHGEIETLQLAIAELKTMEPQHPIVQVADRIIRRTRAFEQLGKATEMNVSNIQMMNGIDFERFLESRFIQKGFKVVRTKASGDFGADLVIETASGTRVAVQAKRFKQKTNLKAVQEVVASLSHYAADFGIVIAASGFFPSAIQLAKSNNVELWDEDKLIRFLNDDLTFSMLGEP